MKRLAMFAIAAFIVAGCAAPAAIADKLEDDPTWNCAVDGNQICGLDREEWASDAWDSFKPENLSADVLSHAFRVTYTGSYRGTADKTPGNLRAFVSVKDAGVVHMFLIERMPSDV